MQPAEQRRPPVRRADLDGVVLLGAVERPEHPHPAGLADRRAAPAPRRSRPCAGAAAPAGTSPTSTTVSPASAPAAAAGRPRAAPPAPPAAGAPALQSAIAARCSPAPPPRRVANGPFIGKARSAEGSAVARTQSRSGVRGQRHAREVAVVGARLQRLGAPAGDREVDRPERAEVGEPLGRRGLGGERQRRAVAVAQRDGRRPSADRSARAPASPSAERPRLIAFPPARP